MFVKKQTGLCLEIYVFCFNQTSALNTSSGFSDVICVVVNDFNSDAKNYLKYLLFSVTSSHEGFVVFNPSTGLHHPPSEVMQSLQLGLSKVPFRNASISSGDIPILAKPEVLPCSSGIHFRSSPPDKPLAAQLG